MKPDIDRWQKMRKEIILLARMFLSRKSMRVLRDNDSGDQTNLALHPDQQFRNSVARVYGAKYSYEIFAADVRTVFRP